MDIFNKPAKLGEKLRKITKKLNNYIKSAGTFAGKHKQIVKASGMAVGIIFCSVIIATLFTPGYEVYLDGEKVAVVADKDVFEKSFDEANEEITEIAGIGYGITRIPRYVFTVAAKTSLTKPDEIVKNVMSGSDAVSRVYVIQVDGKDIATAETADVAHDLIDDAATVYGGENRKVLNEIEISDRYVAVRELTDSDVAVDLLKDVLDVRVEKTSVYEAQLLYGRVENPTEDLYINEQQVSAQGKNGVMEVTAKVVEINGVVSSTDVLSRKVLKELVNEVVMVGAKAIPSIGTGVFAQPYYGTITSRFGARWGRTHNGVDICGNTGDPIAAADNGIVITAEYQENGYGNIIIIDHQNGIHTWYAHLDKINVKAGDIVEKGNIIGELGNTGYSTGPHLHFEVRKDGTPVNPSAYIEEMQ